MKLLLNLVFIFEMYSTIHMEKATIKRLVAGKKIGNSCTQCIHLVSGQLEDNTCQLRKRLTVYERMSLKDVDKTKHLIHGEFVNFIKKKGDKKNPRNDVEFPSYGNVQVRGFLKNISVLIYDISTLIYDTCTGFANWHLERSSSS